MTSAEKSEIECIRQRETSELIHSKENKKYLQEELVTIRNGRYVVPVKNENKAQVPASFMKHQQAG
jgi:DNA mismatch repair protein MutS2